MEPQWIECKSDTQHLHLRVGKLLATIIRDPQGTCWAEVVDYNYISNLLGAKECATYDEGKRYCEFLISQQTKFCCYCGEAIRPDEHTVEVDFGQEDAEPSYAHARCKDIFAPHHSRTCGYTFDGEPLGHCTCGEDARLDQLAKAWREKTGLN